MLWTLGTVPMLFFAPVFGFRCTMSCASRSLNKIVPSGSVTRPHTTSSSVPTWVTVHTPWEGEQPLGAEVVTSAIGVLPALSLPLPS